jgi:hypothetical protein
MGCCDEYPAAFQTFNEIWLNSHSPTGNDPDPFFQHATNPSVFQTYG